MSEASNEVVNIVYICSNHKKDVEIRERINTSLENGKYKDHIKTWDSSEITPGRVIYNERKLNIENAQIILLLISPDFLTSKDCQHQLEIAMERYGSMTEEIHKAVTIIPIILRPSNWDEQPFAKFKPLPINKKPVTSWSKTDEALLDVEQGIIQAIDEWQTTSESIMLADVSPALGQTGSLSKAYNPLLDNEEPTDKLQAISLRLTPASPVPSIKKIPYTTEPPQISRLSVPPSTLLPPPGNSGKWPCLLIILVPAIVVLVIISTSVYAFVNNAIPFIFPSSATVTITPSSENLSRSFSLTAVTGSPDSNQNQVQARQLSYTSQPQAQTVSVTGSVNIPGVQAKGKLTFYNGTTFPQTIAANTKIADSNGVQVANDAAVTIPPAQPPVEGQITVAAHAVNAGANGNIPALGINRNCCVSGNAIYVKNLSSFTGGKDGQSYSYVQQTDIDVAASTLEQALTPATQLSLQQQLHFNEALVTSPVPCTDKVSSDHKVGDKVDHVTVTVVVTCADEAYDKQGAEKMATRLLNQQAAQDPGTDYALKGSIKTEVIKTVVADTGKGIIAIQVTAAGLWVYQFDSTSKLRLAKLVVGKTVQEATNLLEQQVGVAKLKKPKIDLNRISNNILPTDPSKITIVIGSP